MIRYIYILLFLFWLSSCGNNNSTQVNPPATAIDTVHFITHSYIELDKIDKISKFRSGIGHDYWDDFEHCRSMKHYFFPFDSLDWSKIKIYAPVSGKIVKIIDEGRGMQIKIEPNNQPFYNVIIFHIKLFNPLQEGDSVSSGQVLGTHYSNETYSDIAISNSSSNHYRLVSYFDVLPDSLLAKYQSRGAKVRSDLIISKAARDADPLNCNGEIFGSEGTLENWFYLN